jgi:DNA ligase-1
MEACTGNVEQAVGLHLSQISNVHAADSHTRSRGAAASSVASASAETIDVDDDEGMTCDKPAAAAAGAALVAAASKKRPAGASPAPSPSKRGKKEAVKDATQHALTAFFNKSAIAAAPAAAVAAAKSIHRMKPLSHAIAPAAPQAAASSSFSPSIAAAVSPAAAAAASSPAAAPSFISLSASSGAGGGGAAAAGSEASTDPLRPCWRPGEPVPFVFLSRIYDLIEHENGRIKIINWLTYSFWQVLAYSPADLPAALFLSSDQLAPSYENHALGVGSATLVSLVCEIVSVPRATIYHDHQRLGDLGLIAAQYRQTQRTLFKPKPLTVDAVFTTMRSLADVSKKERKEELLVGETLACAAGQRTKGS